MSIRNRRLYLRVAAFTPALLVKVSRTRNESVGVIWCELAVRLPGDTLGTVATAGAFSDCFNQSNCSHLCSVHRRVSLGIWI
jgi:hypothetical protein